ncbi:uncharacterized protein [Lepisosteus oculatus]|uniref:uncharacterized protein n=1 Tax=Lepisosteus oculatus TaxID=7918 RepID=UPI00371CFECA
MQPKIEARSRWILFLNRNRNALSETNPKDRDPRYRQMHQFEKTQIQLAVKDVVIPDLSDMMGITPRSQSARNPQCRRTWSTRSPQKVCSARVSDPKGSSEEMLVSGRATGVGMRPVSATVTTSMIPRDTADAPLTARGVRCHLQERPHSARVPRGVGLLHKMAGGAAPGEESSLQLKDGLNVDQVQGFRCRLQERPHSARVPRAVGLLHKMAGGAAPGEESSLQLKDGLNVDQAHVGRIASQPPETDMVQHKESRDADGDSRETPAAGILHLYLPSTKYEEEDDEEEEGRHQIERTGQLEPQDASGMTHPPVLRSSRDRSREFMKQTKGSAPSTRASLDQSRNCSPMVYTRRRKPMPIKRYLPAATVLLEPSDSTTKCPLEKGTLW